MTDNQTRLDTKFQMSGYRLFIPRVTTLLQCFLYTASDQTSRRVIMAAPPERTLQDLNGVWVMVRSSKPNASSNTDMPREQIPIR